MDKEIKAQMILRDLRSLSLQTKTWVYTFHPKSHTSVSERTVLSNRKLQLRVMLKDCDG